MLKTRIENVKSCMKIKGVDVLFLSPSSNMTYLLGESPILDERLFVMVITPEQSPFIIANALHKTETSTIPIEEVYYWHDGEDPYDLLSYQIDVHKMRYKSVAVDNSMEARFLIPILEILSGAKIFFADSLINKLRVYKDETERANLREACKRADLALECTIGNGKEWLGHSEYDFFAQLSFEMRKLKLDNPGACVCVGTNAAMPHYQGGSGVIENGKCLLVDFGGTYNNYYTDMTRTFYFGDPDEEFIRIHNIVLEANRTAQKAAKLGNQMQDIDIAARNIIESYGYGRYFIHRTGHGIGIDVHESPNAAMGELTEIRPGMAFTIEPGIYLPNRFGVRIEDEILMTESGVEVLHQFPQELIVF